MGGRTSTAPGRWPFGSLVPGAYGLILADPPWRFRPWKQTAANAKRSALAHYQVRDVDWIMSLPVAALAARNSALVLWACAPMLDQALAVMAAWGFSYKTAGAWAKQSPGGKSWAFGTGFVYRGAAEFWLVGARGHSIATASNAVRNLIVAPRREHSRKPDQMHADLERLFPDVRRAELFARVRRPGWDAWGDETGRFGG